MDDVTDASEIRDELPDDLNVTEFTGPYQFPDNSRRRVPALLQMGVGVILFALWLINRNGLSSPANRGFAIGGLFLVALGVYGLVAGVKQSGREVDALAAATAHIGFPVGHASAQLGWRGLLSRPTWRILLYSAENPPKKRGLVLIDAVNQKVIGDMIEDNPEDWSEFDDD